MATRPVDRSSLCAAMSAVSDGDVPGLSTSVHGRPVSDAASRIADPSVVGALPATACPAEVTTLSRSPVPAALDLALREERTILLEQLCPQPHEHGGRRHDNRQQQHGQRAGAAAPGSLGAHGQGSRYSSTFPCGHRQDSVRNWLAADLHLLQIVVGDTVDEQQQRVDGAVSGSSSTVNV